MTFVSYAQNFEDVLLWRALGRLPTGFYVDVGAGHPDTDSVTRAFYDRGWRGINIEPAGAAFLRLQAARPRDINLRLAAGAAPGPAILHEILGADAGLSTLDDGLAGRLAAQGVASQDTPATVDTLAAICRRHAPSDIHFLKIDAEGGERRVLEGADFSRHRPWIVLVEATAPMSTEEVHAGWEPLLLAAGYAFAWFDGLNRFYIAAEHHARLAPSFATPPNVFDDFLRAADTEWARRLHQAEVRAATLLPRAEAAERRAARSEDRAETAHLRLAQAASEAARAQGLAGQRQAEIERLERSVQDALQRAEAAERDSAAARSWLDATRRSTSWRVTAPLRGLGRLRGAEEPAAPAVPDRAAPPPRIARAMPAPGEAPLRAVHQFHSGSAVGDAITNAMLLTRGLLRGLGYDSRIFVEHRDPGCARDIHLIDELPSHARYALIVRHSMGHDALGRILVLPVPKVLLYHNITPPELLEDSPFLQQYSRKGRAQLAELRPAVVAALADSEYNALELRRAGFAGVAACPLLFDIETMLRDAPAPERGAVFTVLFVGRIAQSKGQRELVAAFAEFRRRHTGPARLVLVGRHAAGDPYAAALLADIARLGLGDTVEVTGMIPDAALRRRYAEADLYVSLSAHEGFGVPLIEAMAHGVPVLAWPSGAVPYTLGGASPLLEDTTPDAVAARMLALAADPAGREAIVERQRRSLARFRLARQHPGLLAALAQAGVPPPAAAAAREALAANMRFTVAGHVNGSYSLAEINRSLAATLEATSPGSVRLLPVEADVTTDVSGIPADQRDAMRPLLSRPAPATGPEVVVSQHYPVWVPPLPGDLALALVYWEESLVPAATVATLNAGFGGVLAPTATVAKALIDSGVEVPVRVLGQAPRLEAFRRLRQQRRAGARTGPFTFLHVSSCFPRKGVDALLTVYAAAFRRGDAVRLVIKGFPNPHNDVADQLARLQAADPDVPAVELIDRDLTGDALLALYRDADAIVLPTRGEGFNLPAAEAMAAGIPLIVTGHGGHMDFVQGAPPGAVRLVAYRMAPSATHLATPFSLWAEPDAADLGAALREAAAAGRAALPPESEPAVQSDAALDARLRGIAADLLVAPTPPPVDVAWVTTWGVRCGVAEYARQLLAAMPGPGVILADMRSDAAAAMDALPVIPSWRLGEADSVPGLLGEILRRDPRAVVVQHQPGLLRWGALAALLRAEALQGRVVCATLHNTRHLLDIGAAERAAAVRALAAISRVVVHTIHDVNRLAELGLGANVTLIPQGTQEPAARARDAAPLAPDGPVLIGCYGFFLPGKGIRELIGALALLRRHWPSARLLLVNAEYPGPESAREIRACRDAVAASGLDGAVEFATGFMDHADSLALLASCDLVVLPYQGSKEASSAALRSALAAGVPVAVTPIALFDEAGAAVIRLPGQAPVELAAGIAAALRDRDRRQAATDAARLWLGERSWTEVARRWTGMLRALSASGIVMGRGDGPDQVR